jgi:hypothetical protein
MKIAYSITAVCLLASSLAVLAAEKPKVNVAFAFEAPMYVKDTDLGDAGRKKVSDAALAAFLTGARSTTFYPFIDWTIGDADPANGVTITVTSKKGVRDQLVDLEYRCRINRKDNGALLTVPLYGELDGKFTNDADALVTDITTAIKNSMEDLRRSVVAEIPIAGNAELMDKPNEQQVKILFPASLLQADSERVLLAVYFTPKSGQKIVRKMKLREPLELGADAVACGIEELNFGGIVIDRRNPWNPRLPRIFSPTTVDISKVTVDDYHWKAFVSKLKG